MTQAQLSSQGASSDAIQHHYDVGTEFYRLWLDRECVYSCALWRHDTETLEQAQLNKLDYALNESQVGEGERLLDIGCGWGALMRRARSSRNVSEALGLTLAQTQADHITAQALPGIGARVQNWQDHAPERPYDAIISIGAFEHFARPELSEEGKVQAYRAFFEHCHQWLAPERRLVLQTITYENSSAANVNPFLKDQIFPESELPHVHEIARACKGLFEIVQMRGDREHYARTLAAWGERLRAQRVAATALVGAAQVQHFERYLTLSRLGFLAGNLGLVRLTLRRLRGGEAALGRAVGRRANA